MLGRNVAGNDIAHDRKDVPLKAIAKTLVRDVGDDFRSTVGSAENHVSADAIDCERCFRTMQFEFRTETLAEISGVRKNQNADRSLRKLPIQDPSARKD